MKFSFVFLFFLLVAFFGKAQQIISPKKLFTIDSLLKVDVTGPGYALGIVKNGELVYSKGYGKANLDYNISISDTTAFYIGSMAKQFTAAALLILETQGKLNFERPVTDYLPDFPVYNHEIRVSHLIHHTSGIRETNSLQLFQGIDRNFEEVFGTDDLYQLIKHQKGLNFRPGTEFRYSSGGYAVLAKIIEKVSGQSLRRFLDKHVFEPLGMHHTFVCDNHNEIVFNRAVSYWPIENGVYERRLQVFDAYGDGGIITTVQDLAKWDKAFYQDVLGIEDFATKMYRKGVLNDGAEIDYAFALNVWKHRGQKVVQHNGGMLGFRVDMVRFPKHKTSIILLGNSSYLYPTWDGLKVAEIVLEDVFEKGIVESEKNQKPSKKTTIPKSIAESRAGYYWTDEMNYYRRISFDNDSLFLDSGNIEQRTYLIPVSQNEYVQQGSNDKTRLYFDSKNNKTPLQIDYGKVKRDFREFDATPPQQLTELKKYVGIYQSEELNATYVFYNTKDRLFLEINNSTTIQVYPTEDNSNIVWNGTKMLWIGFGEIKFQFTEGVVTGFDIGDQRVGGVYFKKKSI